MREIVWSDSAVTDLVRLREFISADNPTAAKKAAETIKSATQCLIETPLIGKPVANLPHYRDLHIRFGAGGYLLRYRILDETLYIMQIRHYREENF